MKSNGKIVAVEHIAIWFHKHMIHFMVLFILTGLPLMSETFRFIAYIFGIPASWFMASDEILSTGIQVCRAIHRVTALLLFITAIPFVAIMISKFRSWKIKIESWDQADLKSGMNEVMNTYIFFRPARIGRYNLGQKLAAWAFIILVSLLFLSGTVMMFRDSFPGLIVAFSRFLHVFSFVAVFALLIVHIYIGTLPVNRAGRNAMFRNGEMDIEDVKSHHPLWYEELKKEGKV